MFESILMLSTSIAGVIGYFLGRETRKVHVIKLVPYKRTDKTQSMPMTSTTDTDTVTGTVVPDQVISPHKRQEEDNFMKDD